MTDVQMSVAVLALAVWTFAAWAMGYLSGWKDGSNFAQTERKDHHA